MVRIKRGMGLIKLTICAVCGIVAFIGIAVVLGIAAIQEWLKDYDSFDGWV